MAPSLLALAAVGGMSLVTAGIYAFDKHRARRGGRRVPEKRLLLLALLAGAPGAWWAMRTVRHKTQHARFRILVPLLAVAWIVVLGWLAWRDLRA